MSAYCAQSLMVNAERAMREVEHLLAEKYSVGRSRLYFSLLELADVLNSVKYR